MNILRSQGRKKTSNSRLCNLEHEVRYVKSRLDRFGNELIKISKLLNELCDEIYSIEKNMSNKIDNLEKKGI